MRVDNNRPFAFYIIILLLLIQSISCKDPRKKIIYQFPNGSASVVYEYPDKKDTSSFISITYYPDGKVNRRDTVENFRIVGTPTTYYPDGKVSEIDSLYNSPEIYSNLWNGKMTNFYENGVISGQFLVKNGRIDSLSKQYNMNGTLIKEYYVTDTIKNGEYKEFYSDGKVSFKTTFLNDHPVGFEYYFGENGDTTKYYNVNSKGKRTFPFKKWLSNGNILEGTFLDTSGQTVLWVWRGKDGKKLKWKIEHSAAKTFISPEPN